jgi:hypothetical protein
VPADQVFDAQPGQLASTHNEGEPQHGVVGGERDRQRRDGSVDQRLASDLRLFDFVLFAEVLHEHERLDGPAVLVAHRGDGREDRKDGPALVLQLSLDGVAVDAALGEPREGILRRIPVCRKDLRDG